MERDPSRAIENQRRKHPDWPSEWLEGRVRLRWICDGNGWLIRGVSRRILSGDVDELQLFLEMHVRSRFHWYYKNDEEYTEIWELLTALAIDDHVTTKGHLKTATFPLVKSRGGEAARLFNAVHQLLRDPETSIEHLDLHTTKSCATWLCACLEFISALVRRSQNDVEIALNAILTGYRRTPQINLMEKAIAFCAHGLFRLGHLTAPEFVIEPPTEPSLPWDAALYKASKDRQIISHEHFSNLPKWLVSSIVDLKPLPWETRN
ncbi:hypothetical protein LOC67_22625 [Stieleria sp. JC731]|uniref:hypothetical protein n=1 Tax=Stieleria sp. JC731 TaxID=2894195 RepID=UPI001E36DC43|nr:hypothetical protein [Stieleria sp. JC731]MCC9603354.1 hypothetical protein [Stieleria sp. JC731]